MNTKWFVIGIIIFAIAGYVFITGNQGIQEMIQKFAAFDPGRYDAYKMMESVGGIVAVIGLLIALVGITEKK